MGNPAIDMAGRRFGRLLVLRREGSDAAGKALWRCLCSCGQEHVATGNRLRLGKAQSCGCRKRLYQQAPKPALQDGRRRTWRHVWKKVCPTCGQTFRGTKRQVYCGPGCRPSLRRTSS